MNSKLECFISYCKDDNDLDTVKALKTYLEKTSNHKIDFLIDEETRVGADLYEYFTFI